MDTLKDPDGAIDEAYTYDLSTAVGCVPTVRMR
jgi:hypothetical protein